eukprot:TRINITY_DN1874_c0_g1_i1.p1 TRINITY_DN1874_c0_g1~~TRINITY_DN1874_c0_g1_i1.p1  ORF type:complete len:111 (-),score=9.97 TRINITY_DN1874_c0_g1_i1:135-467(-)
MSHHEDAHAHGGDDSHGHAGGHDDHHHGGGHHRMEIPERLTREQLKRLGLNPRLYDTECSGLVLPYFECFKNASSFQRKGLCSGPEHAFVSCVSQLYHRNEAKVLTHKEE